MSRSVPGSEDSDPLLAGGEDGWEDLEPDYESQEVVCLFGLEKFNDVKSMLEHCKKHHDFDLSKTRQELGLDFYETIMLVNYLRSETQTGNPRSVISSKEAFESDAYLAPVIEGDPLLYSLDDIEEVQPLGKALPAEDEVKQLREELDRVTSQFAEYQRLVAGTLQESLGVPQQGSNEENDKVAADSRLHGSIDKDYFSSYSYNDIHETMLKDTVRTDAYRDFIYDNKTLFKDKVVLDVGCGTAILSMFCAKAGAKTVFAVDNSDIIERARKNVIDNGLQDVITCIRGKIEEVKLPLPKVDVIVSEWMGYCLLYEAMFDSVIWAREHYLAPHGLMVPSHATLKIAPLADPDLVAEHIDFWHDVYGFSMASMLENVHDEVLVRSIKPTNLAAPAATFLELDLHTTKQTDLEFVKPFSVTTSGDHDMLDGWVIWFDIFFLSDRKSPIPDTGYMESEVKKNSNIVMFTTGPDAPQTHWQQGILLIDHKLVKKVPLKDGETVSGTVAYRKKDLRSRMLDIDVGWSMQQHSDLPEARQSWYLG